MKFSEEWVIAMIRLAVYSCPPADHSSSAKGPFILRVCLVLHSAPGVKRESCVMPFKASVSSSERVVRRQVLLVCCVMVMGPVG